MAACLCLVTASSCHVLPSPAAQALLHPLPINAALERGLRDEAEALFILQHPLP